MCCDQLRRAQAATSYQQQLLAALAEQAAAAGSRARQLSTQRRQLLSKLAELSGSERGRLEAQQAAAVEAEDFDTAAAIDVQLQVGGTKSTNERCHCFVAGRPFAYAATAPPPLLLC